MDLPKVEKRKLIDKEEFAKVTKKVRESMKEEREYLRKRRFEDVDNISSRTFDFS